MGKKKHHLLTILIFYVIYGQILFVENLIKRIL
jgi:hypothetical protein